MGVPGGATAKLRLGVHRAAVLRRDKVEAADVCAEAAENAAERLAAPKAVRVADDGSVLGPLAARDVGM